MKLFFAMTIMLLAGVHVACADWTPGRSFDYFDKDRDWNVEFYENCEMPDYHSAQWVEEEGERFLRFTLKNGQVGGCSSDNRRRHRAPYWERAELKQTHTLEKDRRTATTR